MRPADRQNTSWHQKRSASPSIAAYPRPIPVLYIDRGYCSKPAAENAPSLLTATPAAPVGAELLRYQEAINPHSEISPATDSLPYHPEKYRRNPLPLQSDGFPLMRFCPTRRRIYPPSV